MTLNEHIYQNRNNIQETAKIAKQLLEKFYKLVFNREIEYKIEETCLDEEYTIWTDKEDGQLFLFIKDGKIVFVPQKIIHYSGVWRYSDGSGEPPSDEPFDLVEKELDSLEIAVEKVIEYINNLHYQNALEVFSQDLYYDGEEN